MIVLASLLQLALALISLSLLLRLWAAGRNLRMRTTAPLGLPRNTACALRDHLDEILLSSADRRGLAFLTVPARELHDPYRTVDELLIYLGTLVNDKGLPEREKLIKGLYQLQDAVELPDALTEACLAPMLDEIRRSQFMGKPVGRVDRVRRGELVNPAIMWPLSNGTRVRQPLGMVVRDNDGRVISKAKVLCA